MLLMIPWSGEESLRRRIDVERFVTRKPFEPERCKAVPLVQVSPAYVWFDTSTFSGGRLKTARPALNGDQLETSFPRWFPVFSCPSVGMKSNGVKL